jgi:hypothetical protein
LRVKYSPDPTLGRRPLLLLSKYANGLPPKGEAARSFEVRLLALLSFRRLDFEHLAPAVRTAGRAYEMRTARVVALRTLYQVYRPDMLLAAAVAAALAGNPLFGRRTHI